MLCDETHNRPKSPNFGGKIELKAAGLVILCAPLGYLLLTAYLVNKVRPVPIMPLPKRPVPVMTLPKRSTVDESELESVAA